MRLARLGYKNMSYPLAGNQINWLLKYWLLQKVSINIVACLAGGLHVSTTLRASSLSPKAACNLVDS